MESMKRRRRKQRAADAGQTDLQDLMGHFEVHNRTEGKSPRTVEWYNLALGKLRNWLIEQGEPTVLINRLCRINWNQASNHHSPIRLISHQFNQLLKQKSDAS